MKKYLLAATVCLTIFSGKLSYAEVIHCQATYQGQSFIQATILSNTSGFGRAKCNYKQDASYMLPEQNEYYPVSGRWHSTMPGFQWCTTEDAGTTFDSCRFAQREKTSLTR